ncbi:MAG: TrbG/VirB9 family P-type conjugative transfer protein [Caulobacteraceae bacterium]
MRRLIPLLALSASVICLTPALAGVRNAAPLVRKPHHHAAGRHARLPIGADRVAEANAAARVQPSGGSYVNAMQVFGWSDGALYQVYAAPGEVTDIALEPGETLAGTGPVAAGDTVRWVIGDTESGAGAAKCVHILVKPTRADLRTNLVINTDRRTYHLELRATPTAYMASVTWRYPTNELLAIRQAAPPDPADGLDGRRWSRPRPPELPLPDLWLASRLAARAGI